MPKGWKTGVEKNEKTEPEQKRNDNFQTKKWWSKWKTNEKIKNMISSPWLAEMNITYMRCSHYILDPSVVRLHLNFPHVAELTHFAAFHLSLLYWSFGSPFSMAWVLVCLNKFLQFTGRESHMLFAMLPYLLPHMPVMHACFLLEISPLCSRPKASHRRIWACIQRKRTWQGWFPMLPSPWQRRLKHQRLQGSLFRMCSTAAPNTDSAGLMEFCDYPGFGDFEDFQREVDLSHQQSVQTKLRPSRLSRRSRLSGRKPWPCLCGRLCWLVDLHVFSIVPWLAASRTWWEVGRRQWHRTFWSSPRAVFHSVLCVAASTSRPQWTFQACKRSVAGV